MSALHGVLKVVGAIAATCSLVSDLVPGLVPDLPRLGGEASCLIIPQLLYYLSCSVANPLEPRSRPNVKIHVEVCQ